MKLDCIDTLSLLLVLEGRKKKESELWPYIATFPSHHHFLLMNWPARYDPFLMQHVQEIKYRQINILHLRYERIEQIYNQYHLTTAITMPELRRAISIVRTRSVGWPKPKQVRDYRKHNSTYYLKENVSKA